MQPTSRTLLLLLLTAIPLALSGVWLGFAWIAVGWLLVVAALLLADWRLTPDANAWSLLRRHDDRLSLDAWNRVSVEVELSHSLRALPVWLRDEPPAIFTISDADRLLTSTMMPGRAEVLTYDVRPPRRGDYQFGDLYLRWGSVLGLLRRQARFPATESVKVYPNLVDVKKYDLLLRENRLWELGLRNTRMIGTGTEFERLRDYQPDDEYRRINWKATARRGKPISVEYETERSQNLIAMLDIGRMMRSPVGDVARLDYSINAVLLLAFVAARKGDRMGMLTFADSVQSWLSPRAGKAQFHRMLELLYAVQSQPIEPNYNAAFSYFAAKQNKRSLVLVFTDLTDSLGVESLIAQMSRLRYRHLPLLVTISDPAVQRLARQPVTDSTTLYERTVAEQLLDERKLTLDRLRSQGVLTLDVPADRLSVAVINRYLSLKARTRI